MIAQKINSKVLTGFLLLFLLSLTGCEKNEVNPTLDGAWEMKIITSPENEVITEDLWGSVIWDFDLENNEVEVLVDYSLILENNVVTENDTMGFFFGLTDGTFDLIVSENDGKKEIKIGTTTTGTYDLKGETLILRLDYDDGRIEASEIYYFEK